MSKRFTKNDYYAAASSSDECGQLLSDEKFDAYPYFYVDVENKYEAHPKLCDKTFSESYFMIPAEDPIDIHFLACQIALEKVY